MTSYGSVMCCKPCKSTYNRNSERIKGNATLRTWFKSLDPEQKAEFFKTQKETHTKFEKRNWSSQTAFNEDRRYVRKHEDVLFDFVPLREWIKEERQLGFSTPEAIESFKQAWKDPQALTRLHAGIRHVAIYRGIRLQTGWGEDSVSK